MKRAFYDGSQRQLGLFQPRVDLPSWRTLPPETREHGRRLLAQILEEAMETRTDDAETGKKVKR